MSNEQMTLLTAALVIGGHIWAWLDRRQLARKHEKQEPITINLEIVVDPTMTHQPKVSAFQRKQTVPS